LTQTGAGDVDMLEKLLDVEFLTLEQVKGLLPYQRIQVIRYHAYNDTVDSLTGTVLPGGTDEELYINYDRDKRAIITKAIYFYYGHSVFGEKSAPFWRVRYLG
jgi:hypothetical protein